MVKKQKRGETVLGLVVIGVLVAFVLKEPVIPPVEPTVNIKWD